MLFNKWNILVVDDEPDVLSVTKLALRDVSVYGIPLKIHPARSKAEAIELLHTELAIDGFKEGSMAVALIDVVMENNQAGLELCDYIRNDLDNQVSQLFIRTGQPGVAPERDVIDQLDISGYFTKVEMTEQKLYTFVKTGVRQWFSIYYNNIISNLTNIMIQNSDTKQQLYDTLAPHGDGFDDHGTVGGIIFDGRDILTYQTDAQVIALRDELSKIKPIMVTPEGHSLTVDNKGRLMVKILETPTTADFVYVMEGLMVMPPALLNVTFQNGLAHSILWKRAR